MPTTTNKEATITLDGIRGLDVPHIAEYFGWWCMFDVSFRGIVNHVNSIDVRAHVAAENGGVPDAAAAGSLNSQFKKLGGDIAFVEVAGPMMKFQSSMSAGVSTVGLRRQLRAAETDPEIGHIFLLIDSPGGTFAGTADLGKDIARITKTKPVTAFISDMAASAAYWVASQATEIVATETSLVGSIGTFLQLADFSGAAQEAGIKVHVLRAGEFKGRTVPGVELDAEILDEMQRVVNELNEHFVVAVSSGRGMTLDAVRNVADGRVHMAADAVKLGLVDRVSTMDDELHRIQQALSNKTKGKQMSQDNAPAPVATSPTPAATPAVIVTAIAATLPELKAACPGADSDFLLTQLEANATAADATTAFIKAQGEQLAALRNAPPATPATPAAPAAGVDPLDTLAEGGEHSGTAQEQFMSKVEEFKAAGVPAGKAVGKAVAKWPQLHEAMKAANAPV